MEQPLTNTELLNAMRGVVKEEIRQPLEEIRASQAEILDAMQLFASDVDRRFDSVETRLTRVESQMVTKSYLDDKFADEGARTGGQIRDTNLKVHSLTDALVAEGSLRPITSTRITMMNPFPRRAPRRS